MKIVYDKEEGIASVVGTLFSLLLFITLLSTFVTQYVPVYMKTNEEQHDMQVLSQFSQIRTEVDMLTITNDLNYTTYAPITMGAAGIPLFAQQTVGELSVYPYAQNLSNQFMNISFKYSLIHEMVNLYAGGSIEFVAPNRYYVPESFIYFNGALVRTNLAQTNSSVILVGSDFSAVNNNGVSLTFVMQHIYGPSDLVTGTDTRGLEIMLFGTQKNVYSLSGQDLNSGQYLNITFNTTFNPAILQYYKNTANNNQVYPTTIGSSTENDLEFANVVSVTVLNVYLYVTISQ